MADDAGLTVGACCPLGDRVATLVPSLTRRPFILEVCLGLIQRHKVSFDVDPCLVSNGLVFPFLELVVFEEIACVHVFDINLDLGGVCRIDIDIFTVLLLAV